MMEAAFYAVILFIGWVIYGRRKPPMARFKKRHGSPHDPVASDNGSTFNNGDTQ